MNRTFSPVTEGVSFCYPYANKAEKKCIYKKFAICIEFLFLYYQEILEELSKE
jgi:hypothetical protein